MVVLVGASVPGCDRAAVGGPQSEDGRMPALHRIDVEALVANGPERAARPFAVGPSGHVVFHTGYAPSDPFFTVLDTSGNVVSRFGREGMGPGEFQFVFWLGVRDSIVWAYDQAQFSACRRSPSTAGTSTTTACPTRHSWPTSRATRRSRVTIRGLAARSWSCTG